MFRLVLYLIVGDVSCSIMTTDERHEFDIDPSSEMQRKHGWYAENRCQIRI